jgi:hypothetical protein
MGTISRRVVGRKAMRDKSLGAGCSLLLGAAACGGIVGEGEMALTGGGGQPGTVTPAMGGQTSTVTSSLGAATSTAPAACYGRTDISVVPGCYAIPAGPFEANEACVFQLAILPNYKLNPAYLTVYFTGADGTKFVIPYIGALADCASATSLGGWYATNIAGGSTEIGLCACTCAAARKHAVTAVIDCKGVPTS